MARNTKFPIDLDTGHFMVSSDEMVYENEQSFNFKVIESHHFESEWGFDNNLLKFTVDHKDAIPYLQNEESPLYKIANNAKSHHFSVMRYERI